MKFAKKIPLADNGLSKELLKKGWRKIKEPPNLFMTIMFSLPFMFINGGICLFICLYLNPSLKQIFISEKGVGISFTINLVTILVLIAIVTFAMLHELVHAAFLPRVIRSDKTYFGINGIFAFVFTTEEITKNRFLLVSVMPFVSLSLLFPFILNIFGALNGFTAFLCLMNGMGSCVDCLNMCLVSVQAPKGSLLVNNGLETYFK